MKRSTPITIEWKPDRNKNIPVYKQIIAYICEQAASGRWPIGGRLPSQRTLAGMFGVNRSTITAALEELASYGILKSSYGAGTQIASNTWSLLLPSTWNQYVSSGYFQANQAAIQAINHLEFVPDMIRLGTGEPDPRLFPKELWEETLSGLKERIDSLGYLEPLGLLPLRQAISEHMKVLDIHVPPSSILITSGSLQALQLISVCLLKTGSTIFTEAPSYLKSLHIFQSEGMCLSGIPMDKQGISIPALEQRLKAGRSSGSPVLYTIPTNHNPTGITMTDRRRQELKSFCAANRLPIIEDGTYEELSFDDTPLKPLKASDKTGNVIYLGSASKALAPGLRIGWVSADEPIVQRLGDVKMQMDYGASSISQWIFAECLSRGFYDAYLADLKGELRRRRDNALASLETHFKGIASWNIPTGGFFIWLTFLREISVDALFEKAARAHILLNPGDIYDFKKSNSLRLSYSYVSCEEFRKGAGELARIVKEL